MSYIAHKLKHRIQILRVDDTPNSITGGFDRSYTQLVRLWAAVKVINPDSIIAGIANVRGVNISDTDSHEFMVRFSSVVGITSRGFFDGYGDGFNANFTGGLGREFDTAFSTSVDSIVDVDPIKKEYFIFLEDGAGNTTRGRLFKINRVFRDETFKKFIKIKATQIEEQGTGFTA